MDIVRDIPTKVPSGTSKLSKLLETSLEKCPPGPPDHANPSRHPYKGTLRDLETMESAGDIPTRLPTGTSKSRKNA